MRPFQMFAQIIIATSVVNCAPVRRTMPQQGEGDPAHPGEVADSHEIEIDTQPVAGPSRETPPVAGSSRPSHISWAPMRYPPSAGDGRDPPESVASRPAASRPAASRPAASRWPPWTKKETFTLVALLAILGGGAGWGYLHDKKYRPFHTLSCHAHIISDLRSRPSKSNSHRAIESLD
jgi:hypothetical protein